MKDDSMKRPPVSTSEFAIALMIVEKEAHLAQLVLCEAFPEGRPLDRDENLTLSEALKRLSAAILVVQRYVFENSKHGGTQHGDEETAPN